jgi:tetratricopeptide (TPR) repeat protein
LMLEDVHWVDEMSARLLSYLGRHQRQARSFVLVSVREEDLDASSFVAAALAELTREQLLFRVELPPLSRAETHELSTRLAEQHALPALEAALDEQIWTISQGNPLVIVESMRALASGSLARDVTQLPVPERVRALILNRVGKVSPAAREVLHLAAVAGLELELDVLMTALDGLPLTAALDELARVQLVRAVEERVYFTHDRIRETLYGELLPVSRRLLHGRVAKALEQRERKLPATLGHIGYHYSKAGNAPAAVRFLIRFAEFAFRDHGVNEALVALEQAFTDAAQLPKAERDKTKAEIVVRQAYCFITLGRFAELVTRMGELAERTEALDLPELSGPYHFFWGFALAHTAQRREAREHAQRALGYAMRCNDQRVIGFAHALLSYLCEITGGYREGIEHGLLATALLDGQKDSREAATLAWLCLGLNRLWLGEVQAALEAAERAAAIATASDNLRGQALAATVTGAIYAYTDQWELALEATQRGHKASREPFTFVWALWVRSWAQSGSGQSAQAIEPLEQVVTLMEQHGMRSWCAQPMVVLADARLRQGDAASALKQANESLEIADATDDRACVGWAMRTRGQALCLLGEHAAAHAAFDQAALLFEQLEIPLDTAKNLVAYAVLHAAEKNVDKALADLQRAQSLYEACGVSAPLQEVQQLRAAFTA